MSLIGKNIEEQIWNFLKSKGLNEYGVASLMGNLYAESGLNPKNLENRGNIKLGMIDEEYVAAVDAGTYSKDQFVNDKFGFGEAQWTWWKRKQNLYEYAQSKNKSIGDLELQLEFLYKELSESYNSVLTMLKTAQSIKDASNAVLLKFECPADQSIAVQNKRAEYGQNYYNKYATGGNKEGESIMGYKTCTKGNAVKLSANFKSTEFDCHGNGCCSQTLINETLIEYLQKIRDHFNKSITITSSYRCTKHNRSVGGATASRHVKGDAADIVVNGVAPAEVAKYAESIGIKGIGLYETDADGHFVHIDTRDSKYFWYGQAQSPRSTFGTSAPTQPKYSLEEFVKDVQKTLGARVDGIAGYDILQRTPTISAKVNRTHLVVKYVQKRLIALGYSEIGNADGVAGAKFTAAMERFQKDNGCHASGEATEWSKTWFKLLGMK